MKINQTNVNASQTGGVEAGGQTQSKSVRRVDGRANDFNTAPIGRGNSIDHVSLSSLSVQLRVATGDSPEHQSKLESLGKLVRDSKYRVDSQQVSQKIVEDAFHSELS